MTIQFLPMDAADRKKLPVATGVVDYFPLAIVAIAELSRIGNDQHNPGQPLHWSRGKGGNNADELMRHFIERGTMDSDGVLHSTKVAWRALALLQLELEAARDAKPAAADKPTRAEFVEARDIFPSDVCGFNYSPSPGTAFLCTCGATVMYGTPRPAECSRWQSPRPA